MWTLRWSGLVAALFVLACGDRELVSIEIDPRWSVGVPLPIGLTDAAATVLDDAILVAGGESASGASARVYRLVQGATEWQRLADLPDVRVGGQLVVSDGRLYLVGGTHLVNGVHFTDRRLFAYQPAQDRWIERASFPDLRSGAAVAVPGGIIVVGGGFGSAEHGGLFPGDSAAVYDAAADAWHCAAPIRMPRDRPMAVARGTNVHVFGGQHLDASGTVREIEIYDAASNAWSPGGRFVDYGRIVGQSHALAGNFVHFFGGVYAQPGSPVIETHFRYHVANDAWETMPELPTPRAHAVAVVLDGRIHVIGGLRGPRFVTESFMAVVEVFDTR